MGTPPQPHLLAGERLRRVGIASWAIIGLLILLAISAWLLLKIRVIFPPLVLALLIIYLLNPPITRLTVRGVPRPVAAIGVFVTGIALLVLLVMGIYPFLSNQVGEFADDWPVFRGKVVDFVEDTSQTIEDRFGIEINTSSVSCLLGDAKQVDGEDCAEVTEQLREQFSGQAGRITEIGVGVLEALLVFVLAPLLALYLLIDLPHLQRDVLNLLPESHRAEAADLGSKVGRAVGGFFRGQLLVALTVGVLSAIGFRIINLPFWLLIGAIAGFFNLIPLIGPFIGGTIGFLVGTITGGVTLGLKAALVELIVQQLDNHLISPMVMRRAVQLHPATVVLALLAGGTLAGFWGVLLGVPTVAVAKIFLGHLWTTRVLGKQVTPFAASRVGRAPPPVVPESDSDAQPAEERAGPRLEPDTPPAEERAGPRLKPDTPPFED